MSHFGQSPTEPILKPRDLGQILDQSIKLFGRNWKPFVGLGLFSALPMLLNSLFVTVIMPSSDPSRIENSVLFRLITQAEQGNFGGLIGLGAGYIVLLLAYMLIAPLIQAALIDAAARAVLHMEPVPIRESLRVGATRYWAMLGTMVLMIPVYVLAPIVLTLAGLVIFFFITVPLGLLALAVVTVFSGQAIVIEGKGGGVPALSRAFQLGKSRFWPLMGLGIVFNLLVIAASYIITMPISLTTTFVMAFAQSTALMSLLYLVQGLVYAITTPFTVLGKTLAYFDVRIRTEGYDLEVMAQQQQQQQLTPPTPPQEWQP